MQLMKIMEKTKTINIVIRHATDAYYASNQAKELCSSLKLGWSVYTPIMVAISELANNIVKYAGEGRIKLNLIHSNNKTGIQITAVDNGPGISNWSQAIKEGTSSSNTLGLGLSGVINLMDKVEWDEHRIKGTKITAIKWF